MRNPRQKQAASQISEAEAIAGARHGNSTSFEVLYNLHKGRVYSLCLRMVKNVAVAEDLTQEAFLQVYRKIRKFRGESAFSTWLYRVTFNTVLMHLRKKRPCELPLDGTAQPDANATPHDKFPVEDVTLAGSVDRVVLDRAVSGLPAGQRMTFVLHDIEGYEHKEVGKLLGCSIGCSKSQLHKARLKLRSMLTTPRLADCY